MPQSVLAKAGIDLVLDHSEFFIINKPAGLACHGPDKINLAAILNEQGIEPLLCHRLDKGTSGLLIIAKNSEAADTFRHLFEQKLIEKFYLALSHKKGKKKQGSIQGYMQKGRAGTWKLSESPAKEVSNNQEQTKEKAVTQFFSFGNERNYNTQRVFVIRIIGGQSHQIRVALKSNASPIIGDKRYGGMKAERLMLHAYSLAFDFNGERIALTCTADFIQPEDFTALPFEHPSELHWPKV